MACSTAFCTTCTASQCSVCNQGYYLNGAFACIANALVNCQVSTSTSVCTTCVKGAYKGSDNLCYLCQANCASCSSRFVCTTCNANYYLHSASNSCIQFPSNCLTLNATYYCTLCNYGYYLSNGYCIQCDVSLGTVIYW